MADPGSSLRCGRGDSDGDRWVTDIGFYHLLHTSLEEALPQLLMKTLESGKRAVVMTGSGERVKQLDDALWTWPPKGSNRHRSFIPHGTATEGNPDRQPIWITDADDNANGADFLFLTDGASSDAIGGFARCFNLFDGRNDEAVAAARRQWKSWLDAGHTLAYWQQGERGWEKKA